MRIDFDKTGGLVPAIVQDVTTKEVLMLAYMNEEALRMTMETGLVTFWSRKRQEIWVKGESSGCRLMLRNISVDCDADTLLVAAEPTGPTCHNGPVSCFRGLDGILRLYEGSGGEIG